jgi:hypothetical protein
MGGCLFFCAAGIMGIAKDSCEKDTVAFLDGLFPQEINRKLTQKTSGWQGFGSLQGVH